MKAIMIRVDDDKFDLWLKFLKHLGHDAVGVDVRRFNEAKVLAEWQESHLNLCVEEQTP